MIVHVRFISPICDSECGGNLIASGGTDHRTLAVTGRRPYLESRMKVGTMPAAEEKPVFPVESQLEQPCTLPR